MDNDIYDLTVEEKEKINDFTKRLSSKLVDQDTVRKYGTSFQEGMTHDYEKQLAKRYLKLSQELQDIHKDEHDTISKQDIFAYFKKRMKKGREDICNEKYIERLYYILDRALEARMTLDEFLFSYMELEQKLKLKIRRLILLNNELQDSLKDYKEKLEEQKDEKTNTNGVCENASLSITLYEARDLSGFNMNTTPNAFVEFCLEGSKQQSSIVGDSPDPIFNEDFTFPITKRNEELIVTIYDQNSFSGIQEIGKMKINLELLEHQLKTDNWYMLNGDGGTPDGSGAVRLRLRYIYSWQKYYQSLVEKTTNQIKRLKKDINDTRIYQNELEEPFGIITSGDINEIIDSRIFDKSEDIIEYVNSSRKSVYVTGAGSMAQDSVIRISNYKEDITWSNYIKISWLILFCLVLLGFIHRGDFIGLVCLLLIMVIFLVNNKNDNNTNLKGVNYILLGSTVLDVVWIFVNFNLWDYSLCEKPFIVGLCFALHFCIIIAKINLWNAVSKHIYRFTKNRNNQMKYAYNPKK